MKYNKLFRINAKKVILILSFCSICLVSPGTFANRNRNVEPWVVSMSPEYCKFYYVENHPKKDYWTRYLKKNKVPGAHHACWGVALLIKSTRVNDPNKRAGMVHEGVNEISSTLNWAKADNSKERKVRSDLYLRIALAYVSLIRPGDGSFGDHARKAKDSFMQAAALNPSNPKIFVEYSRLYKIHGKTETGLLIIEKGLEYNPENRMLLRHRDRLRQKITEKSKTEISGEPQ